MSRIKVMFIKAHTMNKQNWKVGHKTQMRSDLAEELIGKKIIEPYIGNWPPKQKTKFNLKDLK
jgi:hypothetical protein